MRSTTLSEAAEMVVTRGRFFAARTTARFSGSSTMSVFLPESGSFLSMRATRLVLASESSSESTATNASCMTLKLECHDFEIETEVLVQASKKGFKVHSVSVQTIYRDAASKI